MHTHTPLCLFNTCLCNTICLITQLSGRGLLLDQTQSLFDFLHLILLHTHTHTHTHTRTHTLSLPTYPPHWSMFPIRCHGKNAGPEKKELSKSVLFKPRS